MRKNNTQRSLQAHDHYYQYRRQISIIRQKRPRFTHHRSPIIPISQSFGTPLQAKNQPNRNKIQYGHRKQKWI